MTDDLALFRELRAALLLIRETVEELAPPGSVPNEEYLTPEPMREAEAITRGICAIARQPPHERRMKQLYRSPNGDSWFLVHNPTTGLASVRPQANTPVRRPGD